MRIRDTLKAAVLTTALAASGEASASLVYQMVGARCTDSNRELVPYEIINPAPSPSEPPSWITYGPGPKLCNDQIFAELRLTDDYVPGTWFMEDVDHPVRYAESLYFTDGRYSVYWDFQEVNYFGSVFGSLPAVTGPSDFWYRWNSYMGNAFMTNGDGTWEFWIEGGANSAPCGIGSIEGPMGPCLGARLDMYGSVGTYAGWHLIPEPGSSALLAIAAVAFGVFGRRRARESACR